MADSVIITSGDQPAADQTAAFEAGVATVTAVQATETAEAAVALAVEANETAAGAVAAAFDVQAEIAAVRAELVDGLDRLGETVSDLVEIFTEEYDEGPAPEVVARVTDTLEKNEGDPDKDKRAGKGKKADWWWGTRR